MGRDRRFMQIYYNGIPRTFMTFSICNDYRPYSEKDVFDYLPHNQDGKICFVETMSSYHWNRQMLRRIEEAIIQQYPQVECGIWFRPVGNTERKVVYRRKFYEASLRN